MKKRIFSRVLALVMALSLLSTTAFAASFADLQGAINDSTNGEGEEFTTDSGETRYGYAKNEDSTYGIEAWNSEDGTRNVQLNETVAFTEGTDQVSQEVTIPKVIQTDTLASGSWTTTITEENREIDLEAGIHLGDGQNVRIDLNGHDIDRKQQAGSVIVVTKGGKLTLDDTSTGGNGKITGGTGSRDLAHTNREGGGVNVYGGTVIMNGGNITNNEAASFQTETGYTYAGYGGGVSVGWGSFTMNGGTITDNRAAEEGGGVLVDSQTDLTNAEFVLRNGVIGRNTARIGGGIYSDQSFTMYGGSVEYNTASGEIGGIVADTVNISGGSIEGNTGGLVGGVYATASFTMTGGSVFNNTGSLVGGVCAGSSFTMTGGSVFNNSGGLRGGVVVLDEFDEDNITGHICGNKADKELLPEGMGEAFEQMDKGFPSALAEGHTPETVEKNRVEPQVGVEGHYDEVVRCSVCGEEISRERKNIPALSENPGPGTGDFFAGGDTGTIIEDEEIPLAGLVSIAQLLEELRQYEGIEDVELPEDFQWLDHDYAQAIYKSEAKRS